MTVEQPPEPPSEEAVPSTAGEAPSHRGPAIEEAAEGGDQLRPPVSAEEATVAVNLLIHALVEERVRRNLSQREVARRVGTGQGRLSEFENRKIRPRIDVFMRHVMGLGGRVVILFDDDDPSEQEKNSTSGGGDEQAEQP